MTAQFHFDTGNLRYELEALPRKLQRKVVKQVLKRPMRQASLYASRVYAQHRSSLFRPHLVDNFFVKVKQYRNGVIWAAMGVKDGNTPKHIPTGKGWQKAQFLPGWRFHFLERKVTRRNGRVTPGRNYWGVVTAYTERLVQRQLAKSLDETLKSIRPRQVA